jgi:hypothetical protein
MWYVFDVRHWLVRATWSEAAARDLAEGYRGGYYAQYHQLIVEEKAQVDALNGDFSRLNYPH